MECETRNYRFIRACWYIATRAFICAVIMNMVFYLLIASRTIHDVRKINQHILNAFDRGDLQSEDFPKLDSYRGIDQFSDASLLMQIQFGSAHWYDKFILMPYVPHTDESPSLCEDLRMVSLYIKDTLDSGRPLPVAKESYHRYWEGQAPIGALLMAHMELRQVRLLLTELSYLAFALLAFAALGVSRKAFCCFFPVVVYGILFSEIPYMGQLMIHMGFMISIFTAAGFLFVVNTRNTYATLIYASAVAGTICLFVDQLCGIMMQTMSLMIPGAYLLGNKRRSHVTAMGITERMELQYVLATCIAFLLGAVMSYVLKIGLLMSVYGFNETLGTILWKMDNWMNGGKATIADAWRATFKNYHFSTFQHEPLARYLFIIGIALWAASFFLPLILMLRNRLKPPHGYWPIFFMNVFAVCVVFGWYAVFRNHTRVHAFFMARYLYIPLALGWSNLMILFFSLQNKTGATNMTAPVCDKSDDCVFTAT